MDFSTPRVALTIAGSDSGAGPGAQADLRTFAALGIHGVSALSALTAQSTIDVRGVLPVDPAFLELQIETLLADFEVRAVKTGMLATVENVAAVGRRAASGDLPNLVVDPVLVASTGRPLLAGDGPGAYLDHLLPHAVVATPNLYEAALLTGSPVGSLSAVDAMAEAALRIADLGPRVVVVKGGHLSGDAVDVVASGGEVTLLDAPRVDTANDHGSGCTLASAIAGFLVLGEEPLTSVRRAKDFVYAALQRAARWQLGAGHGPLDQLGLSTRPG